MKKAAGRKTTTHTDDVITEELQAASHMLEAKQLFIAETLNMSWRLAFTVLIPLIVGIQLDKKFGSAPSYTLTGFMIAIAFGCMTVWQTVKRVNQMQIDESKEKKKRVA